jgi:serine/threonine-protein kinase
LEHPTLTKLIDADEIGGGFAMVFEWIEGDCMGRQYPESRERFMQMPFDIRLQMFDDILAFHAHAAKINYAAIDFYDGCIMYDPNTGRTVICDIECYSKSPYINNMGRMWGSSRFMSPEEFQLGAVIDEITNVYTMGATAFALFSNSDRSLKKWPLSERLYDVVKQAVNDERGKRQQSIEQLIAEWKDANRTSFDYLS